MYFRKLNATHPFPKHAHGLIISKSAPLLKNFLHRAAFCLYLYYQQHDTAINVRELKGSPVRTTRVCMIFTAWAEHLRVVTGIFCARPMPVTHACLQTQPALYTNTCRMVQHSFVVTYV